MRWDGDWKRITASDYAVFILILPDKCLLGLGFSMLTMDQRYISMQIETEDHWFTSLITEMLRDKYFNIAEYVKGQVSNLVYVPFMYKIISSSALMSRTTWAGFELFSELDLRAESEPRSEISRYWCSTLKYVYLSATEKAETLHFCRWLWYHKSMRSFCTAEL